MPNRAPALRSLSGNRLRSPFSSTQIELVVSRGVAVFGIVLGAQSIPDFLSGMHVVVPAWNLVVGVAVFVSLVAALVLSVIRVGVRAAHGTVAIVYVIAIVTWPLAVTDGATIDPGPMWLYHLLNAATGMAAIAAGTRLATAYLFVVPAIYTVVRASPLGGGATVLEAALEATFSLILGGAILIVIATLRSAAVAVDSAQAAALESYSHAVRQHAMEVERVQVDSIVHDSVLTTLLSAARARTPEAMALSTRMAHNAIGHLRSAALVVPDDGSTIELMKLVARVTATARGMSEPFEVRTRAVGSVVMPMQAAEALHSASIQAMVNSIQHAGRGPGVSRWVTVRGAGITGIEIEVGDTGRGFSFVDVPVERLGLRVSIIERVVNAGGTAEVDSVWGEGTVITIRWPRPDPSLGPLTAAGVS